MDAPREAARRTLKPRKVMAQVGVSAFDRVGLALAGRDRVSAPVAEVEVGVEAVREVARGGRRGVQHQLQRLGRALPYDAPSDDAASGAVNGGGEVDGLFFCSR